MGGIFVIRFQPSAAPANLAPTETPVGPGLKLALTAWGKAPSYKASTSGIMTMAPIFRVPYDSRL